MSQLQDAVLYEDADIIVCRKSAGIPTQSSKIGQVDMVSLIKNHLTEKNEEPYVGLIHRLDQPVEGVMVFAKNKKAAAHLSAQVSKRQNTKQYLAVVYGHLKEETGTLEDDLLRNGKTNMSAVVAPGTKGAKHARLSYEVLQEKDAFSLVRVTLETGRHHQIRVQFAHAGHPLRGDRKYATATQQAQSKAGGYLPLALCSTKIGFVHPVTEAWMEYEITPTGRGFSDFQPFSLDK